MDENLRQSISLELTLAHLLVLQELVSEKLSGIPLNKNFSEIEKKAVWILDDLIEQRLMDLKVESRLAKGWKELISKAADQLNKQPRDYLT